jgi:hypothetical protein
MKSWYILSEIYLFVLVRSWAEVVAFMPPMMRGVQFLFSFIMACISKREACASLVSPCRVGDEEEFGFVQHCLSLLLRWQVR